MIAVTAVAAVVAAATPEAPRDEGEAEAAAAVAMALWRRRCRRGCRNGKTVPLMLHPSHCLVHRSPNLPTAKERERKNYKGQAAEQAMVISSTWTRDDAQWFQLAETRQKRFTYSDFTNFYVKFQQIHLISVSGQCKCFIFKMCQKVLAKY